MQYEEFYEVVCINGTKEKKEIHLRLSDIHKIKTLINDNDSINIRLVKASRQIYTRIFNT